MTSARPASAEVPSRQSPETVRLQRSARTQFETGHRVEALEIVETALAKKDADPEWHAIVGSWHRQAAADVANARVEADGRQAPTKAQESYQEAVRAEERAKELTKAGKRSVAVRTLWQAEELFVKAGQQAELASQEAAAAAAKQAAAKQAAASQSAAAAGQRGAAGQAAAAGTNGAGRQSDAGRQLVGGANRQQADGAGQPSGSAAGAGRPAASGQPAAVASQPAERPGQLANRSGSRPAGASNADAGAAPPEAQVRHVLREYESAWDRLDADGVRRVFPTFAGDSAPGFRNFTLRIENPEILVNGPHAMVRAVVHHTPRPTAPFKGNGRAVPTILRFQLGDDGHWVLKGMQPLQQQQQH